MTLREQVLAYFADLPVATLRAVRHVEEDLGLPSKTLAGLLNELSEDDSPLFKTLGPYTGEGQAHKGWYNCYARRRQYRSSGHRGRTVT